MNKFIILKKRIFLEQYPVIGYLLGYDIAAYSDSLFSENNIEMSVSIQRSVVKRKAEFLAGRIAARWCLEDLYISSFQIKSNPDRSPAWPCKITGSISHSNQFASCLVAQKNRVRGIGIDLEPIVANDSIESIMKNVANRRELAIISRLNGSIQHCVSLIFAAKESLYKALYPEVQKFFDFSAVEIIAIDVGKQNFVLELNEDLSLNWKKGARVSGYFEFFEQHVFTRIVVYCDE